jgi:hypothetical protein
MINEMAENTVYGQLFEGNRREEFLGRSAKEGKEFLAEAENMYGFRRLFQSTTKWVKGDLNYEVYSEKKRLLGIMEKMGKKDTPMYRVINSFKTAGSNSFTFDLGETHYWVIVSSNELRENGKINIEQIEYRPIKRGKNVESQRLKLSEINSRPELVKALNYASRILISAVRHEEKAFLATKEGKLQSDIKKFTTPEKNKK